MKTHFIVQTAQTRTGSRFGDYRRIAVLEVFEHLSSVSSIREDHAVGLVNIVKTWERLNFGTTKRCAYARALIEANALAAKMNLLPVGNVPDLHIPNGDTWESVPNYTPPKTGGKA